MWCTSFANKVRVSGLFPSLFLRFFSLAVKSGMDIFRVFDSLNYADNLLVGMDAVHAAGGVVQGEMCYTGDLLDPEGKYNLDYYLSLADVIVNRGQSHILGIKDMAGVLKPEAAKVLVSSLRAEFPKVKKKKRVYFECSVLTSSLKIPIHVHTHDTAGIGVASMIAASQAGADVVHGAVDCMSGTTSQPSLGALISSISDMEGKKASQLFCKSKPSSQKASKPRSDDFKFPVSNLKMESLQAINDYWAVVRDHYAPFAQQIFGSTDVLENQIPGGQYSNLMFQSQQLGLEGQWGKIKRAYVEANKAVGDVVKVTPSSKVVGDLAQFMVSNNIATAEQLIAESEHLDLPTSVVEFLQGQLGEPLGGFPEPLRSNVLKRAGVHPITGRPGADLPDLDFAALKESLQAQYEGLNREGMPIREGDVVSAALYPEVFADYMKFRGFVRFDLI
jgi:pyruvate carboxylase